MEAKGRRSARVETRERHVRTYQHGWCIAYYLCVVFVAALRAFFCSHRLLFISTNVQLYWSAIYHPHPAPPTSHGFFPLFENVSGLCRGMQVCYDWPSMMEQPLMLHFVVPACHVILFYLLECHDWIFPQALCFCTLQRHRMGKFGWYLFFCSGRILLPMSEYIRIYCCYSVPCGYNPAIDLVYGYFELDDTTWLCPSLSLSLSFL